MTESQTEALLARITTNPEIFGGKPIIRGKRLAVEHVLADLAAGETQDAILASFPFLQAEDIQACLLFASRKRDEVQVISAEESRPLRSNLTGRALIDALQASPCRDVEIEPTRSPLPVRDVEL